MVPAASQPYMRSNNWLIRLPFPLERGALARAGHIGIRTQSARSLGIRRNVLSVQVQLMRRKRTRRVLPKPIR